MIPRPTAYPETGRAPGLPRRRLTGERRDLHGCGVGDPRLGQLHAVVLIDCPPPHVWFRQMAGKVKECATNLHLAYKNWDKWSLKRREGSPRQAGVVNNAATALYRRVSLRPGVGARPGEG